MFDSHQDIVALTVQDHQERIIAGARGSRRTDVSPSIPEAARKRFGRVLIVLGEHLGGRPDGAVSPVGGQR